MAVAATEDKLAISEEAEAMIEDTRESAEEINELAPDGTLVAKLDANESAEEIAELAPKGAVPTAEVTSLTTAEASEVAAEKIELTSWAVAAAAKASTRVFEKCMLNVIRSCGRSRYVQRMKRGQVLLYVLM